jgi:hypothetical protein
MDNAQDLNEKGRELHRDGDLAGAEAAYREAIAAAPHWSVPYFNLGLVYKYDSRWVESLEYNQRAAALDANDEGSWWNLGIAATALGSWSEARRAWSHCGMAVPPGDGPPEFRFGNTPIRLDPGGNAEVVWARRLDPARARILSVPLPTSPHNAHAVVLNDGAPDGHRRVGDVDYPVFNMLAVLEPSPLAKYVIELATVDPNAVEALERIAFELEGAAENWGRSTNIMCADCSRGLPHEHPDSERQPAHPHCGLAAKNDDHAEQIIRTWLDTAAKADLIRWYDAAAGAE